MCLNFIKYIYIDLLQTFLAHKHYQLLIILNYFLIHLKMRKTYCAFKQKKRMTNFTLPEAGALLNVQAVQDSLVCLRQNLDSFMIALREEDRKKLLKMGNVSKPFVERILDFMHSNPEFISPLIKTDEMRAKFDFIQTLLPIFREFKQITRNLDDTLMLLGSDVMTSANVFYSSVKHAKKMRIPNATPIFEELQQRYLQKPNRSLNGKKKSA
jgi:hypothetical protein